MPKAEPLTPEALAVPPLTPHAATPPRSPQARRKAEEPPKADQIPLQVRLPRDQVRAIKIAAAERELTISEFMLACLHAFMKK